MNWFHFWIRTFSCEIYFPCWSSPRGSNSALKGSVINDVKQTSVTITCDWGGTLGALVTVDSVPGAGLCGSDRLCPLLKSLERSGCTDICFSRRKRKKSHRLFIYVVIKMFSFSHIEKINALSITMKTSPKVPENLNLALNCRTIVRNCSNYSKSQMTDF